MNQIVESKLFTDEQKVSVFKAVVDKSIVLDFVPEFVKIDDYYFIKNENTYQYVMTFKNGFEWMNLGMPQDEFIKQFVFNKMNITNSVLYCAENYIVVYNKETIFPYMRYDISNKLPIYFSEGKNYRFIKHLFSAKLRSMTLVHFIEYVAQNDIGLLSINVDDLLHISYNEKTETYIFTHEKYTFTCTKPNQNRKQPQPEKQPEKLPEKQPETEKEIEKDEFMLEIDKLEDSATMKKNIEDKKVADYKRYVISQINDSVRYNCNYATLEKNNMFSHPEITEFLQYICTTKNFTIAPNGGIYKIYFF